MKSQLLYSLLGGLLASVLTGCCHQKPSCCSALSPKGDCPPVLKGQIADSARYEALHPRLAKAFAWLRAQDLASLSLGRHPIDGDAVFANVMEVELKPWSPAATVEAHRDYCDIHVPIGGDEIDGYQFAEADVKARANDFKDDYILFPGAALEPVAVKPGEFVLFAPPFAAHAPNLSQTRVGAKQKKLVIKVKK